MNDFFSKTYNIFFTLIIVIIVILLIICFIMKGVNKKKREIFLNNDKFFEKANSLSHIWLNASILWMTLGYMFIISSFAATVIVIYLTSIQADYNDILFYSIFSLLLTVVLYEVNPKQHMHCYRKAFVYINNSINLYVIAIENNNAQDIKTERDNLIKAMSECENIINSSYGID